MSRIIKLPEVAVIVDTAQLDSRMCLYSSFLNLFSFFPLKPTE